MDNLETCNLGHTRHGKQTLEKTEEIITNGQSRDIQPWAHRQKTSMEMPMVLSIETTIFLSRR